MIIFIIIVNHSPLLVKAHYLEELLQVQYRPTLSTRYMYSVVLCLFTLFFIITSERETLFLILNFIMQFSLCLFSTEFCQRQSAMIFESIVAFLWSAIHI